jgi:hypothetical protein
MITSRSRDPSQVSDAPRVLMLSRRFHPVFGGAAIQAARLSAELADRQCSITIVAARIGALPASETLFGLPVFRTWEVQKGPAALRDLSFALSSLLAIFQCRRRYQILHLHGSSPFSFIPMGLAKLLGKRIVLKMHSDGAGQAAREENRSQDDPHRRG